jgi:antitoxin component YwqK of YwqJK toxin-antitoxin module
MIRLILIISVVTITILFLLKSILPKSINRSTIGKIIILLSLLIGLPALIYGFMLIAFSYAYPDGQGLEAIIGIFLMIFGVFIMFSAGVPALLWFKPTSKQLQSLIFWSIIISVLTLALYGYHAYSYKSEKNKLRVEQKKKIETIRRFQDKKILEAFSQKRVVPVGVKCSYALHNSAFRQRNKGKKDTMNMQFIHDHFVEPAGRDHIFKINFVAWTYFYAQVTREGYDQLKNNTYVEYIELQEREGAMSSHEPSSGLHKKYYSNGQLDREWMIDEDGAPVWLKNYYITGEFHVDVKYTNGGRDRLEKEYYKSGKIKSVQQYKDYKLVDGKDYDEEGSLVLNEGTEEARENERGLWRKEEKSVSDTNSCDIPIAPFARLTPYEECVIDLYKKRCNEGDLCIVNCLANGRAKFKGGFVIAGGCWHVCFASSDLPSERPQGMENCEQYWYPGEG